jgi:NAD(P)-dependent dehydrogenase (short-subunit alcohol dehydrogenase family)
MRAKKTALVTGANKGIGFEVARELARFGMHVFLGARHEKAGRAAARKRPRSMPPGLRSEVSGLRLSASSSG